MRPGIFITGGPTSGKSTLATKLSQELKSLLISPSAYFTGESIQKRLENGDKITKEEIQEYMRTQVGSDESIFKGYVVDDLQTYMAQEGITPISLIESAAKTNHVVIVNLEMSEGLLLERTTGRRVDYTTGTEYNKDQLKQSSESNNGTSEEGSTQEDTPAQTAKKTHGVPAFQKLERQAFEQAPDEARDKLIQNPYDLPDQVSSLFQEWSRFRGEQLQEIKALANAADHKMSFITTTSVDSNEILSDVLGQLKLLGYHEMNAHLPRILDTSSLNDAAEQDTSLNNLKSIDVEENEPARNQSIWGAFDPVTYFSKGTLVPGTAKHVVVYKTFVYVFENNSNMKSFASYPDKYLSTEPKLVGARVSIHGHESPEIMQNIMKEYEMNIFDVDKVLNEINIQKTDHPMYDRVFNCLKDGKVLSGDIYVELLKNYANDQVKENWAMVDYPLTSAQTKEFNHNSGRPLAQIISLGNPATPNLLDISSFGVESEFNLTETEAKQSNTVTDYLNDLKQFEKEGLGIHVLHNKPNLYNNVKWAIDPFYPRAKRLQSPIQDEKVRYGHTGKYCPVALSRGVLYPGKTEFGAELDNKTYIFSDEDSLDLFLNDPVKYLNTNKETVIPPPRLAFTGVKGSGKSLYISKILKIYTTPSVVEIPKEMEGDELREKLKSLFTEETYLKHGFIVEGFPRNNTDLDIIKELKLCFDAILVLNVDPTIIAKRNGLNEEELGNISNENNDLNEVRQSFKECPVIELENEKTVRVGLNQVLNAVKSYFENRLRLIIHSYEVEPESVADLTKYGVVKNSDVYPYCPVALQKDGYASELSIGNVPIIVDDILYTVSEKYKEEFQKSTYKYLKKPHDAPFIRPNICVIGGKKSQEISKSIATELNLVYLEMNDLLENSFTNSSDSEITQRIHDCLLRGESVQFEMLVELANDVLLKGNSMKHGFIFDGFPENLSYVEKMEQRGIHFHCVVYVMEDQNALSDEDYQSFSNASYEQVYDYYNQKYDNTLKIEAECSAWFAKEKIIERTKQVLEKQQIYLERKQSGMAIDVTSLVLDWHEIESKASSWIDYCPVDFVDKQELCFNSTKSRDTLALYKNKYYNLCGPEHKQKFLNNPELYYSCELPMSLPKVLSSSQFKSMFPKQVELQGYCPVTLTEGPEGFKSIVQGNPELIVEYENKMYSLRDEEQQQKFMRRPWMFVQKQLPAKLPPKQLSIPVANLPTIGYMEQTVAGILTDSLVSCGKLKPKYPFKSVKESALEYIALHLKANNPKLAGWVRENYAKKLRKYESECVQLEEMTKFAAGQQGKERVQAPGPEDKEFGYVKKLDELMSLKSSGANGGLLP